MLEVGWPYTLFVAAPWALDQKVRTGLVEALVGCGNCNASNNDQFKQGVVAVDGLITLY